MNCTDCHKSGPVFRTAPIGVFNKIWVCRKCLHKYPNAPKVPGEVKRIAVIISQAR